jgi:hypothetical protein
MPNLTLTLDEDGRDVRLHYDYTPATRDVWYLSNGDPGYPGDPEEIDITEIWVRPTGYSEYMPTEIKKWSTEELDYFDQSIRECERWV